MSQEIRLDIANAISQLGINIQPQDNISTAVFMVLCGIVAFITYLGVRWGLLQVLNAMLRRSQPNWAKVIVHHRIFEKLSLIVPVLVLDILIPLVLNKHVILNGLIDRALSIWLVFVIIRTSYAFLDATKDIADSNIVSRDLPVKSFLQLFKLIIFLIGMIVVISILSNKSPVYFFSGLGVATGLVLLVFRDTILGFVAGIQLSANRMVSVGDWIQMDKYGANGSIEEVSLTTVKVKNWDNTLTNIPAYALVQDSFINWRPMEKSGGRRIKRSVLINIDTIKFIDEETEEQLSTIPYVASFITKKKAAQASGNPHLEQITNISVFRGYLEEYLRQNSKIRQDMTFLVRELEPTPQGLPIQIYVFTNDTRWAFYEGIQADIFDHVFAIIPQFGLAVFQSPASEDVRSLNLKR